MAAALALATGLARGGELSKTYEACVAHTSSNAEWSECGGAEIDRQDQRLNAVWQKVMKCLTPASPSDNSLRDARKQLLDEQRLWLKWKESSCGFYDARGADGMPTFGREGQVLDYPACRATVLAQRSEFLEGIARDVCAK